MNQRQSLKAAEKHIEELEYLAKMNKLDIQDYNKVIDSMIKGGNPCEWCEDFQECQLEAKGKGCEEWMLRFRELGGEADGADDTDECKGIHGVREQI